MTKTDKIWIKSMELANKYWGCHQIPERSLYFRGYQFPICARCTGMLVGELTSLVFNFFININSVFLLMIMIPMSIDGALQYLTIYESNNLKRFVTGLLFGFSLVALIFNGIKFIF